ncbi:hypothetical protein AC579_987 [Pseudocercospora musae]|uniref:Uncharacterized protein n=1 Tax=Pseudocercospora musae TaxID=113226 RepID=A0A139I1C2_9PEZI|nr:hypothetical protein AC579_987 [Pseudocercospora musae]
MFSLRSTRSHIFEFLYSPSQTAYENAYRALKDKKMRDLISQAQKRVKDIEYFEWTLKLIMGASLAVLMVEDLRQYEL